MGRRKQFDPDVALERAMEVFWLRGYQNASIGELLAAMGINRWSLYETFGDKQQLCLAALQLYRDRWRRLILERLAAPGPARQVLVELLREMGRQVVTDKLGRGCLLANSAVELRHLDAGAAALVRHSLDELHGGLTRLLERAAAEGDFRGQPGATARFLVAALNGIRDVAKMAPDRKRIHELVESLIATL